MSAVSQGKASSGWRLDEMVTIGRENLDADHVARYDDKEDSHAAEEVGLVREFGLGPQSTIIDLGAGTGQSSLTVAPHCSRVVAVEISPLMLARLRTKLAASGLSNVDVVEAGLLSYEHSGPPVDFVYSRWALHHLPDFWKAMALRRIRALLCPGGLLRLSDIVFSFGLEEMEERIEAWCATLPVAPPSADDWSRADIEEHVRDEHSTFTWLLEPMLERSGF
ncbi:MAG TPA: class I SAM-dependent methyltransferase [Acidimicrobiales bacterium]|nr:class I SAM-dependent methyltransferase [Acidimicrobiales bacterium]